MVLAEHAEHAGGEDEQSDVQGFGEDADVGDLKLCIGDLLDGLDCQKRILLCPCVGIDQDAESGDRGIGSSPGCRHQGTWIEQPKEPDSSSRGEPHRIFSTKDRFRV